MSSLLDITNFSKARVLRALYNQAKPQQQGLSMTLYPDHLGPLSEQQAQEWITQFHPQQITIAGFSFPNTGYLQIFDCRARAIRADLSGNAFDPTAYEEVNGAGSAQQALLKIWWDDAKWRTETESPASTQPE